MGLRLVLQPHPLCPAFYAISVRRLGTLPAVSFRFRLTADTLAVRLTLPITKRVVDFHHQAIAHGGRTTQKARLDRITERVGLWCLDQDIDSDIFPLTCLEVVDARCGFNKLAGVHFIDGQLDDFYGFAGIIFPAP